MRAERGEQQLIAGYKDAYSDLQTTMEALEGDASQGGTLLSDGLRSPLAAGALRLGDFMILCAEPGMGKSLLAARIMKQARDENRAAFAIRTEDSASEGFCAHLVRYCRDLTRKLPATGRPLVVVDGICPPDEREVVSEARALEKLHKRGCQIVVCLRPEAEQLVEALPSCQCLRADELLYRSEDYDSTAWEITGGIPLLVAAHRADEILEPGRLVGAKYAGAIERLVDLTLRSGLPFEELRVRLAMVLLGHGTLDDVRLVAGRCDMEQLAWLRRDVPLLGIGEQRDGFVCHGLMRDDVLRCCLHALQVHAADEQDLVVRACGVLASRGDVRRSATVCTLLSSEAAFARVGTAWGALYAAYGEVALVEEALRVARTLNTEPDVRGVLSEASVSVLTGPSAEVNEAVDRLSTLALSTASEQMLYRHAALLAACRDVLRNPRLALSGVGALHGDIAGSLAIGHIQTAKRLATGRFAEAYACISNDMVLHDPDSISACLLCDDLYVALLLSGGVPDRQERALFAASQKFFSRVRAGHMQTYHAAIAHLPAVLLGYSDEAKVLEDAANQADRVGDRFLYALLLAVMAVNDVRGGALSRAHVRAEKAGALARVLDEEYLASSAELVDALALTLLGEIGVLQAWCEKAGRPESLAVLGRMCAYGAGEMSLDGSAALECLPPSFAIDSFWAINFIADDCRSISEGLQMVLPTTWRNLLEAIRHRQETQFFGIAEEEGHARRDVVLGRGVSAPTLREGEQGQLLTPQTGGERVRVSVLGGFRVEADGQVAPDKLLDRRRARDLVMLLAVVPSHRLRRYQIAELLWPELDYVRGPRKLYEATGEARKQLSAFVDGLNPIIADRSQGSIGYDLTLIGCDVDEFEREARLTLSEDGDDFGVLDHARNMTRLFSTGPDPHLETLGEQVSARLREIRDMYVDAAVAAGEAALRLGKAKLAVRYGTDAHQMNGLREDAMLVLVHGLRASGRGFEVAALYRSFSRALIETEGVPPSLALRRAVALATEDGLDALSA